MAFVIPAAAAAISSVSSAFAASTAAVAGSSAVAGTATSAAALAGLETASIATAPWLSMANVGLATTALGGVVGAYGAVKEGEAASAAAKYSAQVNDINAAIADNNEAIASHSGFQQTAIQQQKTRAYVGELKAQQAASGLDVNSGSAVDVRSSAAELGQLDALTVRSNATREAYGYTMQGESFRNQADLEEIEAENAGPAAAIKAGSTILGSAGDVASNWYNYKSKGGLTL